MVQKNIIKDKILIICGATATSKTALSIKCAKLLDTEIISADSMNVYKGLNIGTAKPSVEEMDGIKHHLIDVVEPTDSFSVGDYKILAEKAIQEIINKGKIPIVWGGTGFYINSILYDMSYGKVGANLVVRDYYIRLAQEKGNEYVYGILKEKDPAAANKIHFNDTKRVVRALEIYSSGTKKSDINDNLEPKYNYKAYSIAFPRETLYSRINKRVDIMFEDGLLKEVEALYQQGITLDYQSMQGIGYKEFFDFFHHTKTLENVKEQIKLNTRHYAKRQLTFFKKLPNLQSLPYDIDVQILAERIVKEL